MRPQVGVVKEVIVDPAGTRCTGYPSVASTPGHYVVTHMSSKHRLCKLGKLAGTMGRPQAKASHLCRHSFASKLSSILRPYFLCSDGSIWLGELKYDAINFGDS